MQTIQQSTQLLHLSLISFQLRLSDAIASANDVRLPVDIRLHSLGEAVTCRRSIAALKDVIAINGNDCVVGTTNRVQTIDA